MPSPIYRDETNAGFYTINEGEVMLSRSIHDWTKRTVYDLDYPESLFPLIKQYCGTLSEMSSDEIRQLISQHKGLTPLLTLFNSTVKDGDCYVINQENQSGSSEEALKIENQSEDDGYSSSVKINQQVVRSSTSLHEDINRVKLLQAGFRRFIIDTF